jgi:hypothetical protein
VHHKIYKSEDTVNVPTIGENSAESPGNGSEISCKSTDFSIIRLVNRYCTVAKRKNQISCSVQPTSPLQTIMAHPDPDIKKTEEVFGGSTGQLRPLIANQIQVVYFSAIPSVSCD